MLSLLSKISLFITSYFPLFIIFIIIDLKNFSSFIPNFYHNILTYLLIFLLIFSIIFVIILFKIMLPKYWNKINEVFFNKIKDNEFLVKNNNHEVLTYLFTYLIPFLWIDDNKRLLITIILLWTVFIIYIKSDLFKYNIFLLIFWYDIIAMESNNYIIYIIKKQYDNINYDNIIRDRCLKISDEIYLYNS